MRYRFDLHVHSDRSPDSVISPKLILTRARELGLNGFSVTDHDAYTEIGSPYEDLIAVPGMEITIEDINAHILAVGIQGPVRTGLDLHETMDMIHDLNGVSISPHNFSSKEGFPALNDRIYTADHLDGIEVTSPRDHVDNLLARKAAGSLGLARVGGSDAHHPSEIGYGFTVTRDPVYSVDDLMDLIRRRKTDGMIRY
ncbi:MAG: PHP domain-containing protein [Thermoplasmatota archaeon]